MNKRQKLITTFLLIVTMTVSGSYVFAGTEGQPSDEGEQVSIGVTNEALPGEALPDEAATIEEDAQDMTLMSEPENSPTAADEEETEGVLYAKGTLGTVTAVNYDSDTTTIPSPYTYNYQKNTDCYININATTSGKLWIYAKTTTNTTFSIGQYDPNTGAAKTYVTQSTYANSANSALNGPDVVAGRTYFVKIYAATAGSIQILPYVYSYATRTLPEGSVMYTAGYKTDWNKNMTDSNALFMIKPAKTGFITVAAVEYGYSSSVGYVTLLNASKKAVSDKLFFSDTSQTGYVAFGVQKGVTYYLQASGFQGSSGDQYVYGIQYKNYAAALRANTSKKKATKLKRKANYIASAMPATGKSGNQWYKFKVKKKRTTKLVIDATYIKSGTTKITVYCGKKKIGSTTLSKGQVTTLTVTNSNRYGKAKKGTYYVKVSKSASANGQYRIRYLK